MQISLRNFFVACTIGCFVTIAAFQLFPPNDPPTLDLTNDEHPVEKLGALYVESQGTGLVLVGESFDYANMQSLVSEINDLPLPCHLYFLDVSILTSDLLELAQATNIPEINIAKSRVSNDGLQDLSAIKCLRQLVIQECTLLDPAGVSQLRKTRPDIKIFVSWLDPTTAVANPNNSDVLQKTDANREIDGG